MQNILSIQRSTSGLSYQELESRISFLNQKVRDLENHVKQLTQSHITIPMISGNEVIRINGIVYCRASSNYTIIHLVDGQKVCVSKTLKYIQSLLPYQKFVRIHQSHLINVQYIKEYQLGNRAHVQLKTSETLPISKTGIRRVQDIFSSEFKSKDTPSKESLRTPYQLKVMKN